MMGEVDLDRDRDLELLREEDLEPCRDTGDPDLDLLDLAGDLAGDPDLDLLDLAGDPDLDLLDPADFDLDLDLDFDFDLDLDLDFDRDFERDFDRDFDRDFSTMLFSSELLFLATSSALESCLGLTGLDL